MAVAYPSPPSTAAMPFSRRLPSPKSTGEQERKHTNKRKLSDTSQSGAVAEGLYDLAFGGRPAKKPHSAALDRSVSAGSSPLQHPPIYAFHGHYSPPFIAQRAKPDECTAYGAEWHSARHPSVQNRAPLVGRALERHSVSDFVHLAKPVSPQGVRPARTDAVPVCTLPHQQLASLYPTLHNTSHIPSTQARLGQVTIAPPHTSQATLACHPPFWTPLATARPQPFSHFSNAGQPGVFWHGSAHVHESKTAPGVSTADRLASLNPFAFTTYTP